MSNIELVWDNIRGRGDWQVSGSRLSTGNLLTTAVIICLFTDRVAQPDYVPEDGSGDRHGWWHDSFDGTQIGSRLWQLRRRKIANRNALIAEATDIVREALQPLITSGIAAAVDVVVTIPPADNTGSQGTVLKFTVTVFQPTAPATIINALWNVGGPKAATTTAAFATISPGGASGGGGASMPDTARTIGYLTGTEFVDAVGQAGITPQTVRDLIVTLASRSWVSVTQYGAVGNGVADDTTSINNAIASGASVVLVNDGTYMVNATGINLTNANQTLWLTSGATLKASAGTTIVAIRASGCTVTGGGTIDANNIASTIGVGFAGSVAANSKVEGIVVQNTAGWGIYAHDAQNVRILRNRVINSGSIAIYAEATTASSTMADTDISGNYVDRTAKGSAVVDGGIKVHATGTSTTMLRARIANNTVLMPTSPADGSSIGIEIATGGSAGAVNTNAVVANNTTSGGIMGISLDTGNTSTVTGNACYNASLIGIEIAGCIRSTCSGNAVEGNGLTGTGITADNIPGGTSTTNLGVTISGNSVNGCTTNAIKLVNCTNATCSANTAYLAISGKQVIFLQNSTGISLVGGHYDGGGVSDEVINIIDCNNVTITGATLAGGGLSAIGIGADVAGTYDNINVNSCSILGAKAIVVYAFTGAVFGNNITAINCTGVVGALTTNGNARRGSCLDWTNQVWDIVGSGTPASSVTAGPGSIYRNQAGGTTTTLYVKESGTTNTGWVAK